MLKILIGYILMLGIFPSTYFTGIFVYLLYGRVIGALLLYFGLKGHKDKSRYFSDVLELTLLLSIATFLFVTIEIIDVSLFSNLLITSLRVLIDLVFFFVTYRLILGVREIEQQQSLLRFSDKVLLAFYYMTILYLAQLIFSFEPLHTAIAIGYTLCKLFFIYRIVTVWQHYKSLVS
ncbi:hypothetical protein AOC36_00320 [Erysipelothrix larvae]|uniref:Uncharacterized protein n=1 Tax=Erysipelothrix larvae TaxID=1514105 RepID=A0A109UGF1_9FIRM|nr:hypothetical protein [Erysipelothrix larvae]AMC92491.1 hypothetical protein AOC36_00320 [Erysipelothrix larvae]